ncbi:hypothetical protein GG851_00120 [Bordetella petrii]|nr:hypothetical protein [Bordetella petrii]
MDLLLDEQEIEIREAAAEFLAGECSPALVRKVEAGAPRYSAELWSKFAANGWLQLCLSEAAGGQGLPLWYLALLFELTGKYIAPIPLHATMVPALAIDRHGSPGQRKLLEEVVNGKLILSHAVVDRLGRWSPERPGVEGRVEGAELVLNGTKSFVDSFDASSLCALTYRDAGAGGKPGVVLVPTDAAGIESVALLPMAKDDEAIVHFNNVRVPLSARIGAPEAGQAIAIEMMDIASVLYASQMAGAAGHTLAMAVEHAKERVAFGQPIGAFQAIQHMSANMLNGVDGSTLLAREALWRMEQKLPYRVNVAQAKSFANEHCMMVCRSAQQIHGGMGFMLEFDLNLWYRRVGSWSLRGGTSAEHRRTVAAALLDQPGKVRIGAVPHA